MQRRIADPYAQCKELDGWDLYAVDGHYHKAACFDPKSVASDGTLRATATGHFFLMNMRTHHLSCLAMAEPKDGKKKEHDMAAIKRSSAEQLRNGAPVGRKVMLIWDKACIDYRHWHKLKHTYGIYFITLEKSNSAAEICSVNQIDHTDPRNEGVVSDHLVGTPGGVLLRRIVYTNPADGVTYTYLTSYHTLPAYQIVLLYKHRWDIEKIFHQFKSKIMIIGDSNNRRNCLRRRRASSMSHGHGQKTMDCDESECGGAPGFLPLCFAGGRPQAGVRAG